MANVTANGDVCLRSHSYFLARYKPTGEMVGKRGAVCMGPEHLFDTEAGCKAGITWFINHAYSWHPLSKEPGHMDKSNWEVVPVTAMVTITRGTNA